LPAGCVMLPIERALKGANKETGHEKGYHPEDNG
jgi:hypothetical protein